MITSINAARSACAAEPEMEIVRVLCADPAEAFAGAHTPKTRTTAGRGKAKP